MTKAKKNIPTPDKKQRYFAQELLNDVFSQDELRSQQALVLGSDKVFHCNCPFCFSEGKDQRLDNNQVRKHFLWNFEKFIIATKGKTQTEKRQYFVQLLQQAAVSYKYLEDHCAMVFNKSSDSSFIPIWHSLMS